MIIYNLTNDFTLTQPEPPAPRNILTELEGVTIIALVPKISDI